MANVLLVHGLGRTPVSLFGLAAVLRRAGPRTHFFGYSPTLESLSRVVRRLSARIALLTHGSTPLGLVGHSLGGVLLNMALATRLPRGVHQLITLGTPLRSPRLAHWAIRRVVFRLLTRDCGRLLCDRNAMNPLPAPDVPTTVIAGTAGPRGRYSPFGDELNDGIVAVSEACPGNNDATLLLPVWHTVMMNDARVRDTVVFALSNMRLK